MNSNDLMYMLSPSVDELQLLIYDFYDHAYTSFAFSEWATRISHLGAHLCPHIRFLSVGGIGPLILADTSVLTYFTNLHQLTLTQQAFDCRCI